MDKAWSIYLKLVAFAPLAGITFLWLYLDGTHISLVAFVGASSHMLVAVALIGLLSIAFSWFTFWLAIWLPFRSEISRVILSAMRRRSLSWRHKKVLPYARRPIYWLALTYTVPCFVGVLAAWYWPWRDGAWLLWIVGVPPSVVTWFLLRGCGVGQRMQPFYALTTLLGIAFTMTSVTFILFMSIRSLTHYVAFARGEGLDHWWELTVYHGKMVLLVAALSIAMTALLAPTDNGRANAVKLTLAALVVLVTAIIRSTPVYIVQVAFYVFAGGGEHRVYTSVTGTALEIPRDACLDSACHVSRPIRVAADFGDEIYAWYDYPGLDGKPTMSSLQKIAVAKTEYKVESRDAPAIRELQIL